jgi:DMSO/TMAO reductase YedYZ molybdopterin-dependent catalytic subunit
MKFTKTRRQLLRATVAASVGFAGWKALSTFADRRGFLAPDHQGILGVGESLTYGSQRLLAAGHSMAREFPSSEISAASPVNHTHPEFEPYTRLLANDFVDWRLYVDGLVGRPTAFSLAGMRTLPRTLQITQLTCEEGWSYIAAWAGVRLSVILKLVGASSRAKWVVLHSFDDFWGSIDMPEALHPQTLLAYELNGQPLSADHGAPLRLRIPRQLGYKNTKFLARITVVDSLKNIGEGLGSAAPEIGYSWYAGI